MKKKKISSAFFTCVVFFCGVFLSPKSVRADMFGGDLPLLAKIVVNTLTQIERLQKIVSTGKKNVELIREINKGINDSLKMLETSFPEVTPGIYKEWSKVQDALKGINEIYGPVVDSPIAKVQKDTDVSVAEAITLNNSIYSYSKRLDKLGEEIKRYSHDVSPGGAQKLTAQGMGVLINVMNQGLRAQATGLKLQAQNLAIKNKQEKDQARLQVKEAQRISDSFKALDAKFALPRF